MLSKNKPVTPWGACIMFWLLIAAILYSSVPFLTGAGIAALIPRLGELRNFTPWLLLHFLWIYPVMWFTSIVTETVITYIFSTEPARKVGGAIRNILIYLALAIIYHVTFFSDPLGAMIASLVSCLLLKPFVNWLERNTPPDDADDANSEDDSGGPPPRSHHHRLGHP